jgi:hypothetical protein
VAEHHVEMGDTITIMGSDLRWLVKEMSFDTNCWAARIEMQEERAAIMRDSVSLRMLEQMWTVAKRLIEENESLVEASKREKE